jgi:hypothetical protein
MAQGQSGADRSFLLWEKDDDERLPGDCIVAALSIESAGC